MNPNARGHTRTEHLLPETRVVGNVPIAAIETCEELGLSGTWSIPSELEAVGIAFISLRDNLDLATPSGRLMFQIIGAMEEVERALNLGNSRRSGSAVASHRIQD